MSRAVRAIGILWLGRWSASGGSGSAVFAGAAVGELLVGSLCLVMVYFLFFSYGRGAQEGGRVMS